MVFGVIYGNRGYIPAIRKFKTRLSAVKYARCMFHMGYDFIRIDVFGEV